MIGQANGTFAFRRVIAGVALMLMCISSPALASPDDTLDPLFRCDEIPGCTKMLKAKGFADRIDATAAAARQLAIEWFSNHPPKNELESTPLDPQPVEKQEPSKRISISAQTSKEAMQKDDDSIYAQLSVTCAIKPVTGDCDGAIERLNILEAQYRRKLGDPAFLKQYPNGIGLRAPGYAASLGIEKVNGEWDRSFGFKAPPQASRAVVAVAAAAPKAKPPFDLEETGKGCVATVAAVLSVDTQKHIDEFNQRIRENSPVTAASIEDLGDWIEEIDANTNPELRMYLRYEKCIYEKRIQQLRLAQIDSSDGILRRQGGAGALAVQMGFAEAEQWERDAPLREAAERQRKERYAAWSREHDEWQRKRAAKEAQQASGSDSWGSVMRALGTVVSVATQGKAQTTQGTPGSNCIGTQASCTCVMTNGGYSRKTDTCYPSLEAMYQAEGYGL